MSYRNPMWFNFIWRSVKRQRNCEALQYVIPLANIKLPHTSGVLHEERKCFQILYIKKPSVCDISETFSMERLFQSGRNICHFEISAAMYSQIGKKNMANVPASFDVFKSILSMSVHPSVRNNQETGRWFSWNTVGYDRTNVNWF
jgi:hypothetical protein